MNNSNSMLCPKCQKTGAKYSTAYPDLIVHKCDGAILEEVGQRESPVMLDSESPSTPQSFIDKLRAARKQGFRTIAITTKPTDYLE